MIYKLQRKFILVSTVSVLLVVILIFFIILILNIVTMNRNIDILADGISAGRGKFPPSFFSDSERERIPPKEGQGFGFLNSETPFATRHFSVLFDDAGEISKTNTEFIYAIGEESAAEYAKEALSYGEERGWLDNYRYKVFSIDSGKGVVFVDASVSRSAMIQSIVISGVVLLSCAALVLMLIVLLSKRVVKPIAESYEKQRQFVTDANHELKTPLTLILANLDIAESELGENEWLGDIRTEGNRMAELVEELVSLSRMDEESKALSFSDVAFGATVAEAVGEFGSLAREKNKRLILQIDESVRLKGDGQLLSRLIGILLDNAFKYCDEGGEIFVTLVRSRHIVLTVENSYLAVDELDLNRLFDRFYRADKARSYAGGYGIGLSMAKSIVEKHKGDVSVYKRDGKYIGFKVVLKR